jgi:hypothetical protein
MNWSDVTAVPSSRKLRQFALLWLLIFGGRAAWLAFHGTLTTGVGVLGAIAVGVGAAGLLYPASIRLIYTGWMIAAFPLGWAISHLVLAILYYGLFTPVAAVFRMAGRDELKLRRPARSDSYWSVKSTATDAAEYLRQS